MRFLFLIVLVACKGEETPADGATFSPAGTITIDNGASADVAGAQAFAYAINGTGFLYISSNPAATCEGVVEYLTSSEPYDPADVLRAGHCNLSFAFSYEGDDWDGATFDQEDLAMGIWSVNCAMDTGTWSLEDHDGYVDYFYDGSWWQGAPTEHATSLSGTGSSLGLDVTMEAYDGDLIYEALEAVPGTGHVSGSVDTSWCALLATTPYIR